MNRYFMIFSKTGYIKYISHLDMLRLFKRAFKRTGIALEFSHGFNPHPKMGFAQPLSLGYTSLGEYIEFETVEAYKRGCYLDGWSEHFDLDKWYSAVEASGTDIDFYTTRKRSFDEVLPWQIIDCSVRTEYLRSEAEKAEKGQTTRDCRYGCAGCGINSRVKCETEGILHE